MVRSERNSVGGLLLVGLGALILLLEIFNVNLWSLLGFSWPVFVLIPGVICLALAASGTRKMAGFVFPGAIITGTGAILWYQQLTDHWESWAYMWTLYPAFVGMALMFFGARTAEDKAREVGRALLNYSIIAFLAFGAFFELFIFHSNGAHMGWMIPLALIVFGGLLFFGGRGDKPKRKFGTDFPQPRRDGYISPRNDLQHRINEAIAEPDPVKPTDPQKFV